MLDEATRRQLQQLRFLLEEALARTQQQAEIDRRAAIILLDGACEYAMALALSARSLNIKEGFPAKYEELRAGFTSWQPDRWRSIKSLHEARNLVQHHSVLPDPTHLPTWAGDAQRFITGLIDAVFGLDLTSVLVSEAVVDEVIRQALVESERAIVQEDADASFAAAVGAFDIARKEWQSQRLEMIGPVYLQYSGLSRLSTDETDPVNRSLLRFEDLLEVAPFAPDIAEYHWLLARSEETEDRIPTRLTTARRAFTFVLAWVLRWEAFTVRYEVRQYPPPAAPYEPPTTGAEHPVLVHAEVDALQHVGQWHEDPSLESVRYSVKLTLADIPEAGRGIWADEVGNSLNEIIAERGSESVSSAGVYPDGIVRLQGVKAETSPADVDSWLQEAIAEGGTRYEARLTEWQALIARLPEVLARVNSALSEVESFGIARPAVARDRDGDGVLWLGIPFEIDASVDEMLPQVLMECVYAQTGGTPEIRFYGNTLWLPLDYEPHAASALVATALAEYRHRATVRAEGRMAVAERRQMLEQALQGFASGSSKPASP